MYILGQFCGVIGAIITIIQPQFRKKEQILICCALVNTMSALNYALIGQAASAALLCVVAVLQSFVSLWHDRRGTQVSSFESILFFFLYVGFGLFGMITSKGFVWGLNRANALQLLPIIGALMLMLSVFAKGEQKTRMFLLFNGAIWSVYTAVIRATSFFTCAAAMISSAIALWKHRKKQTASMEPVE